MANELTAGAVARSEALLNPNLTAPPWLKSSLDALTADYPPRLPHHAGLTEDQRTRVEARLSRLVQCLEPATSDEAATFIVSVQDQFGTPDMDPDALRRRQEGFLIALEGVPAFALDEAYRRILQKRAGFDPRFMPRPPELRGLLDQIAEAAFMHRVQLHRLLQAKVEAPRMPAGPRALPPEVSALLARPEGEKVRRRHPQNPSGVDHSEPYHFSVKGE
ncbi:hypothetical protein [Xanthobacter autotrophicus]|uniref:hypothetical protein n=1 Tax=Xanthobacter autotrophicus TaxID=280 RepID=UPI00372C3655